LNTNLELSKVSITLNGKQIVDSVNLKAVSGDVIFITGDNGSGKSTLLKAIARYLPVSAGDIFFNARHFEEMPLPEWHRNVHFLPQHNTLAFPVEVKELLIMAFFRQKKWYEAYTPHQWLAVKGMAERFGITHLLNRNAKELSGGELQLCWLVQSFLAAPPVLLLDEPTQYLDAKNRTRFFSVLHEMQAVEPFICICVTHDLPFKKEDYGQVLNLSN
jgi:iron complex transport system ATP-binding protein